MARKKFKLRKAQNKSRLEENKKFVKSWLGIGGEFSALELVLMAAQKLEITARGDIHPNQQLRFMREKIERIGKPSVNRCRTMKGFYESRAWKILRYQAFEKYGNRCQCCGATPDDDVQLHADHVKPRSTNPELALDLNNIQILCVDCNVGKLNQFDTDWRNLPDYEAY